MEQVSELGRLREIVGEADREKYRLKGQVDKGQREVQRLGEEYGKVGPMQVSMHSRRVIACSLGVL